MGYYVTYEVKTKGKWKRDKTYFGSLSAAKREVALNKQNRDSAFRNFGIKTEKGKAYQPKPARRRQMFSLF